MDANVLEKAMNVIADAIVKSDIDNMSQTELLINLRQFLNPENYEKNIAVLRENMETIKKR